LENTDPVVYGLDIGVYNIGARAQVLSSTTTAWCRFPCPPTSLNGLTYSGTQAGGSLKLSGGWSATCGRSVEELAKAMTTDFNEGKSIALGFEAPMWFPVQREHSKSLSLFSPRFSEEARHEWYLQAGAAATLKAASLGCLLLSQIERAGVRLAPSTDPDSWRHQNGSLILFEAFVAGRYKLVRPSGVPDAAANEWDAATAALSWLLAHGTAPGGTSTIPTTLHRAGSRRGAVMSVWSIILGACVTPVTVQGPPDSEIVAVRDPTAK
jgi:hypothetical protein